MESLPTLVHAARSGDARAFGEIVDRFRDMSYATCHARIGDVQLAQDAVQEAFLDAWQCLGQLLEPAAFPGWFRRILIKHADRQTRVRRPTPMSPDVIDDLGDEFGSRPDADFDIDHRARVVRQAVAALPATLRDVTILFYLESYSIKQIAAFLDISEAAAKKRLFMARKRLGERELSMVEKTMKTDVASAEDDFTKHVKFYVALRSGDLSQIKRLVLQHPELVSSRFEWGVGSDGHYWPLGATPLFWAVATDDEPLFTFLASEGAGVEEADRHDFTPLHAAVQLRRPEMIRLLLQRGAKIDARNARGQTPLMIAVQRNDEDLVTQLVEAEADLAATDDAGRTVADWATAKGFDTLAALLTRKGSKQKGAVVVPSVRLPSIQVARGEIFETGVKIVDLFTPFVRGGHMGLFSPLAGVGVGVLTGQLVQNAVDLHDAYVVFTSVEEGARDAASLDLSWRSELGLSEDVMATRLLSCFAAEDASDQDKLKTVEDAVAHVVRLRDAGHEVLHVMDDRLATTAGVLALARSVSTDSPGDGAACTTLWLGHYTAGLEPAHYDFLDGVICFSRARSSQRLLPAVDPIHSWSRWLRDAPSADHGHSDDHAPSDHARLAAAARGTLLRYTDLHVQYENRGLDGLFYLHHLEEDRVTITRARRVDRFLTQPFVGVEAYSGIPGVRVTLADTLEGVRRILAGEVDGVAEEDLEYLGTLDGATPQPEAA